MCRYVVIGVLVALLLSGSALFAWFMWRQKFVDAHRVHEEKLDKGLVLVDVKTEGWSDGCDVVLYYSDGSTHVINDTGSVPPWAIPKGSKR